MNKIELKYNMVHPIVYGILFIIGTIISYIIFKDSLVYGIMLFILITVLCLYLLLSTIFFSAVIVDDTLIIARFLHKQIIIPYYNIKEVYEYVEDGYYMPLGDYCFTKTSSCNMLKVGYIDSLGDKQYLKLPVDIMIMEGTIDFIQALKKLKNKRRPKKQKEV